MTKRNKTTTPAHVFNNNTDLSPADIAALPVIGKTVNNWRQRNITLHAHPTDPTRLVSVGVTFDGAVTVVCDESRDEWRVALDYIAHGKVYVFE